MPIQFIVAVIIVFMGVIGHPCRLESAAMPYTVSKQIPETISRVRSMFETKIKQVLPAGLCFETLETWMSNGSSMDGFMRFRNTIWLEERIKID